MLRALHAISRIWLEQPYSVGVFDIACLRQRAACPAFYAGSGPANARSDYRGELAGPVEDPCVLPGLQREVGEPRRTATRKLTRVPR